MGPRLKEWSLRDQTPNAWTVSDYLKVGLEGMPAGCLLGLDVTCRCNLAYQH